MVTVIYQGYIYINNIKSDNLLTLASSYYYYLVDVT